MESSRQNLNHGKLTTVFDCVNLKNIYTFANQMFLIFFENPHYKNI